MCNRFLSILLVLCCLISLLPVTAQAAGSEEDKSTLPRAGLTADGVWDNTLYLYNADQWSWVQAYLRGMQVETTLPVENGSGTVKVCTPASNPDLSGITVKLMNNINLPNTANLSNRSAEYSARSAYHYSPSNMDMASNPAISVPTRTLSTLQSANNMTVAMDAPSQLSTYGGDMTGPKFTAKGHFYTTKSGGRWYVVDPEGYPYYMAGMGYVTTGYWENQISAMKTNFLGVASSTPTATVNKLWAEKIKTKLFDDLGFSAVGHLSNMTQLSAGGKRIPYTLTLQVMRGYQDVNDLSAKYLQVFDPAFEAYADEYLRQVFEENYAFRVYGQAANLGNGLTFADDPYLVGVMTDNEMPGEATALKNDFLDLYLGLTSVEVDDISKKAAQDWLKDKTGKTTLTGLSDNQLNQLRSEWTEYVYDRYYALMKKYVQKHDPNCLYMGSRLLFPVYFNEGILRAAGRHCDVYTFNYYFCEPYTVVSSRSACSVWTPESRYFQTISREVNKPFVVTEFYAKSRDTNGKYNIDNLKGAGAMVDTQQQRADFYENYTLKLLECKDCVGFYWLQYLDNHGQTSTGDAANKGIYNSNFDEYTELTDAMRRINRRKYNLIDYFDSHSSRSATRGISGGGVDVCFDGILDGNGFTISNLYCNDTYATGLFSHLTGTVKNLTISSGTVTGVEYTGSIAGIASGNALIQNCCNQAAVTATGQVAGGLVGRICGDVTIENCYNLGSVAGAVKYNGGLVGQVDSGRTLTLKNCYSVSSVYGCSSGKGGLLIGLLNGTLKATNTYARKKSDDVYLFGSSSANTHSAGVKIENYAQGTLWQTNDVMLTAAFATTMGSAFTYPAGGGYPVLKVTRSALTAAVPSMLLSFNNTSADQARYRSISYGGYNYDSTAYWAFSTDRANSLSISDGCLTFNATAVSPWLRPTGKTGDISGLPLALPTSQLEVIELRVKITGSTDSNINFITYYTKGQKSSTGSTQFSNNSGVIPIKADGNYHVLTVPVDNAMRSAGTIRNFSLAFNGLTKGTVSIDYFYIGPAASCPTCLNGHIAVTDPAVKATCATAGKTEGSHCSICKTVLVAQQTIPATGHSYTSKVTTAATCTNAGVKTFTCSKCNHSYTEAIAATGHTEVVDKAVAATCTTDGKTEGSHCSVCNAVINAQTTVPATGHSYTSKVTTAATCTKMGVKTFTCTKCSHSYTEAIAATGHTEVVDKAVAATCTTAGKTEGSHCSVCNAVIKAQTTVPATGHSYTYKATKNPTTSATGTLTGTCSNCSGTTTVTLPKLNTTDYTKTVTKAATCTATGTDTYKWKTTTYGSFSFTATTAALGHSYTTKVTAPTCTAQGYTTHTCSRCSDSYKDTYTNATGHSYTSKVTTAATCTNAGVKTYTCSTCSHSYTEAISATGHTAVTDKAVAATCTTAGKTEGSHCSVCNAVIKAQTTIPATGHSYTSKVTTAATCTKDGVKTFTCSKCNHSYTEAIAATGHTPVTDKAVAATCTTAGKTEGSHCSVCNAVIKAQTTIPATGHSYTSKVTTAATCTKDGVKTFTCSKCSHSYTEAIAATGHTEVVDKAVAATCTTAGKTEGSHCSVCNAVIKAQATIPATGHSYSSKVTTAATCTKAGVKTFTCSKCSHSYTEAIAATGHTEVVDKAVAATCTTAGKAEGSHCSVCNAVIKAQTTIPATGHSYTSKVTTAATCTKAGVKTFTCSKCNHSYTEAIAATGHTPVTDKAVAATCTTAGKTEGSHCSVCNAVIKAQETVPATGHSYSSKVTTAATCTKAGVKTFTCSKCNHSYTEAIAATGHTPVTDKAVAATCTTAGKTEGSHCSVCNAVIKAQETVPDLGHDYTGVITAPTCTEQGYTAHTCSRCSDSYKDSYTDATGHSYRYTDKGETHEAVCAQCSHSMTEAHSYTDNTCVCGAVEVLAPITDSSIVINHSLNLASDISINYAVKASLLSGYDSFRMEVQVPIYNGNALTGFKTVTIEPVLNGSYYYFTMKELTAIHMNDLLVARLHMNKGKQEYVSKPDSYSVATYALGLLNQAGMAQELKVLCADLLRYGAAAQTYKNYRTDALATASMTEAHKAYWSDLGAVTFGNTNTVYNDISNPMITWAGKTLNLGSKVVVKFVFNAGAFTGDVSKLTLRMIYQGSSGAYRTVTLSNPTVYNEAKRMYAFDFDGLMAAELRTALSVAVYNGDTQLSQTMQYSADTYGNSASGTLLELCKALFAYSDSAKAFFAK